MEKSTPVKILMPGEEERWDIFVASHKFGTIYHTSLWKKIIGDSYDHIPLYLYKEDQEGNIQCGLPLFEIRSKITGNRFVCLPCVQECNPLVSDQEELDVLIGYVKTLQVERKCSYIELRTTEDFLFPLSGFSSSHDRYFTYVLDLLPKLEEIERTFHKNIQRDLKKLAQHNLNLDDDASTQAVMLFYDLYMKMRLEKGLLPQPLKFFVCMWKTLASAGCAKFLHARHEGKVISSILLITYKDTVIYEYGASLSDKLHFHPSHFLLKTAIDKAKTEGHRNFDFGRTEYDNIGLATFKERWGTKRKALIYYYSGKGEDSETFRDKKNYKKLMAFTVGKLPQWAVQICGRILYRHVV